MKKILISCLTIILSCTIGLSVSTNVSASSTHFNKAPKVLKGSWKTKTRKTPKKYSSSRNRYAYTDLYITNKQFHLEDFMLNKHKGNEYNSGPYGAYSGKTDKLGFQKMSSRHYDIWGNIQPMFESRMSGFSVYLSESHRSMKVYSRNITDHGDYYRFGAKHYIGRFYR